MVANSLLGFLATLSQFDASNGLKWSLLILPSFQFLNVIQVFLQYA